MSRTALAVWCKLRAMTKRQGGWRTRMRRRFARQDAHEREAFKHGTRNGAPVKVRKVNVEEYKLERAPHDKHRWYKPPG